MNEKMRPIVDAEYREVNEPETKQAPEQNKQILNMDDVAYMVTVGRYKDGRPFFIPVNVTDLFTVRGALNYAEEKIRHVYKESFESEKEGNK